MFRIGNIEFEFVARDQWHLIVPVMALIAGLMGVLYATERKLVAPRVGLMLTGLRLLLVAVLTLALLDLRIRSADDSDSALNRRVAVALDTSWSMDIPDARLDDVGRLRAADAAGMLPAGTRKVKLEAGPVLLSIAETSMGEFADSVRLLADSLSRPTARLDGPHPLAVRAAERLRLATVAIERTRAKIDAALGEGSNLSEARRKELEALRDGPLEKLKPVLADAKALPLSADDMLKQRDEVGLVPLAGVYREHLAKHAIRSLQTEFRSAREKLNAAARAIDTDVIAGGGTDVTAALTKVGETPRRQLAKAALAKAEAATLGCGDRYRVKAFLFDREAVESETEAALARFGSEPVAPLTRDRETKLIAELIKDEASRDAALRPAFTDFDALLRAVGKLPNRPAIAALVVVSDGVHNPPPGKAQAGALRRLAGRTGIPVVAITGSTMDGEGDSDRAPRDVRIVAVDEPRSVFKGSEAEVFVEYSAVNVPFDEKLRWRFELDGKEVERKEFYVGWGLTSQTLSQLRADAAKAGDAGAFEALADKLKPLVDRPFAERPAFEDALRALLTDAEAARWGTTLATAGSPPIRIPFKLDTQAPGNHHAKVEVLPVKNESVETNNSRGFSYTVADSKLRVLLVDEEPRWEWRFIKDTVERDKERVALDFVLFKPGELAGGSQRDGSGGLRTYGKWPATQEELDKYDVILLGDLDPDGKFFRSRSAGKADPNYEVSEHVERIRRFVQQRGGTLIASPGRRYFAGRKHLKPEQREAFEQLLPLVFAPPEEAAMAAVSDENYVPKDPFKLEPTEAGKRHATMRLSGDGEDNEDVWRNFPPQYWRAPAHDIAPGAEVLLRAKFSEKTETEPPAKTDEERLASEKARREEDRRSAVITHHRSGLGRVLAIGLTSTWRLRYKVGDKYHHRLWGQLVRWAAPGGWPVGNEFVSLRSEKPRSLSGEAVRVEARIVDKKYEPAKDIEPEAIVYLGDPADKVVAARVKLTYVEGSQGVWRAELAGLRSGQYEVVPDLGKSDSAAELMKDFPKRGLPVDVRSTGDVGAGGLPAEVQAELTHPVRNASDPADALNTLASASGGLVLDLNTLEDLPALLEALEKPIDHLRRQAEETGPRWALWILLSVFVLLVAAEWIIRKSVGLI